MIVYSTNDSFVGMNLYAYAKNNYISCIDSNGYFVITLFTLATVAVATVATVATATVVITVINNPSFQRDLNRALNQAGNNISAIINAVRNSVSNVISRSKSATKVPSNTAFYIYRHGGVNIGNLVPRQKDVDSNSGLSFSTELRRNSWRTTIAKINSTGGIESYKRFTKPC